MTAVRSVKLLIPTNHV